MKKKQVKVKGCFRKNLLLSLGMLVFFGVAGILQAAQQPSRFQPVEGSNESIIRDNSSGLEWQRCPYGQNWTGADCGGSVWKGDWFAVQNLTGPGEFRVPTIDELKTLAPYDQNVFPGAYWFWSSSAGAYATDSAWRLNFYNGNVCNSPRNYYGQVRFVRARR
jgi:hypothetical protein